MARLIFWGGLAGGENSVLGVELVLEVLGVVSMVCLCLLVKPFDYTLYVLVSRRSDSPAALVLDLTGIVYLYMSAWGW